MIVGNGMSSAAALFGAGVGTLVYILFTRKKSPVFLGSSFALPLVRSPIAFPARERPIIATVGPITTTGISLFSQSTPTNFTSNAIPT